MKTMELSPMSVVLSDSYVLVSSESVKKFKKVVKKHLAINFIGKSYITEFLKNNSISIENEEIEVSWSSNIEEFGADEEDDDEDEDEEEGEVKKKKKQKKINYGKISTAIGKMKMEGLSRPEEKSYSLWTKWYNRYGR